MTTNTDWLSLMTASGLGGLLVSAIRIAFDHYAIKNRLSFDERKESYIGLLQSLHDCSLRPSDAEAKKRWALWMARVKIAGSKEVCAAAQLLQEKSSTQDELSAINDLIATMRQDLKISK